MDASISRIVLIIMVWILGIVLHLLVAGSMYNTIRKDNDPDFLSRIRSKSDGLRRLVLVLGGAYVYLAFLLIKGLWYILKFFMSGPYAFYRWWRDLPDTHEDAMHDQATRKNMEEIKRLSAPTPTTFLSQRTPNMNIERIPLKEKNK
jgi:hypothetical protein